jgi:hypothetical protein
MKQRDCLFPVAAQQNADALGSAVAFAADVELSRIGYKMAATPIPPSAQLLNGNQ